MQHFYLTAQHLHVQQHSFAHNEQGLQQFAHWLQQHPQGNSVLLVDVVEEDFRLETLAHATGKDQRALLQRKLEQFYLDTPFHQAQVVRAISPREDLVLFSALTNPTLIKSWLDVLQAQQVPIQGIYSVPHLGAKLVDAQTEVLLLSWQAASGLRQSYISQGVVRLSRLSSSANLSFAELVAKELPRTLAYLKSQNLTAKQICLIGPEITLNENLPCHYLGNDAQALYLSQLAACRNNYAGTTHTQLYRLKHYLRYAQLGCLASLLASLSWAGNNVYQSQLQQQHNAQLHIQQQQLSQQLQQLKQPASTASSHYPALAEVWQKLQQTTRTPEQVLIPLSQILNQFPQLEIQQLDWQISAKQVQIELQANLAEPDYANTLAYMQQLEQVLQSHYQVQWLKKPLDFGTTSSLSNHTTVQNPMLIKLTQGAQ